MKNHLNARKQFKSILDREVKFYYTVRSKISYIDGMLYISNKIIVSEVLQLEILCKLHAAHLGVEKQKNWARQIIYWKKISGDIEQFVNSYQMC